MAGKEGLGVIAKLVDRSRQKETQEETQKLKRERIERLSAQAFTRASNILGKYGETRVTYMGTGAGPGIIGYRLEQVDYRKTPPIKVQTDSEKVQIYLTEKIRALPNYGFDLDSLDVMCQKNHQKVVLFAIKETSVLGLDGEITKPGQFKELGQVLGFLRRRLQSPKTS